MGKQIRKGIITENKLVTLFATTKQKENYNKNGHFTGTMKQSILNNANLSCDINEIGNREYEIIKVFGYKLPAFMPKLHTGLYQYIVPLILSKLINERDKYQKVNFTLYKWARLIDMVNYNYLPMKINKNYSEQFNIDSNVYSEYFDRVDDSSQYYIQQTLEYLKKAGVAEWFKVPMVCKRKISIDDNLSTDKHKIDIDVKYEKVRATEEETQFALQCMDDIQRRLKIETRPECFFGKKSHLFASELSKLLKEKDIEYFYSTYEAYCLDSNIKKCKAILNTYGEHPDEYFVKAFNNAFRENIISLATKRYEKIPELFNENYIAYFQQLTDITINKNAEKIPRILSENKINIKSVLEDNIDLTINGNKINIKE